MINSAIYNGQVIHKRFKPKVHYFKYKVFSLLLDLSELEILDKKVNFFSFNKFNLISFHEKDHGERDGSSLKLWVQKNLEKNNIQNKDIKIKILCYPRIFGFVFNPLSVFYVYNLEDQLISILYEVKNTFGEQHTYIFKVSKDSNLISAQFLIEFKLISSIFNSLSVSVLGLLKKLKTPSSFKRSLATLKKKEVPSFQVSK